MFGMLVVVDIDFKRYDIKIMPLLRSNIGFYKYLLIKLNIVWGGLIQYISRAIHWI